MSIPKLRHHHRPSANASPVNTRIPNVITRECLPAGSPCIQKDAMSKAKVTMEHCSLLAADEARKPGDTYNRQRAYATQAYNLAIQCGWKLAL